MSIITRTISTAAGLLGYCIQYGCYVHCTFEYIGDFVICSGPSMEPTIYSNNILLTERITPRLNGIKRGDIIIARCPNNPKQHICKRIIGLPGDRILLKSLPLSKIPYSDKRSKNIDRLDTKIDSNSDGVRKSGDTKIQQIDKKINQTDEKDENLSEKSLPSLSITQKLFNRVVTVPRGHVWIEGDNFENSSDSRSYGPIPQGLIKSRAICRLWPIKQITIF